MANRALVHGAVLAFVLAGCEKPRVADPDAVVQAYADAARTGDSDAIYRMLSSRSQRELGRDGVRQLVHDSRAELARQAEVLGKSDARVEATAIVPYDDGETALLELEEGVFKVGSAAALPSAPRTPSQALAELRRALAQRNYAAFVRILTAETKGALDNDVSALVRGLEEPETLDIQVRGDAAEVELPGGHVVKLKRERGIWRVEDLR